MPRRHPKEDDKPTGPSPAVLAERRERRKNKRMKKSPIGTEGGLLVPDEMVFLRDESRLLRGQLGRAEGEGEKQVLAGQLRAVESEIEADREAREAYRASRSFSRS